VGAALKFFPDQPPAVDEENALLKDKARLAGLRVPDPEQAERTRNRALAVKLMKERVGNDKVVEGWIEGPCAEGADLRGINTLMLDFFDDPAFVRDLFEFIVELELRFARFQVTMGADLIGVGDAAASLVGPKFYNEFVWPYEKKLVGALHAEGLRRGCTSAATRGRSSREWAGCTVPWLTWIGFLRCPRDGKKWDRSRSSWAISIPCEFSKRERPNPFMKRSGSVTSRLETDSLSGRVVKFRGGRRRPT
jgi:uroporphyrinogen-III decarboxylase